MGGRVKGKYLLMALILVVITLLLLFVKKSTGVDKVFDFTAYYPPNQQDLDEADIYLEYQGHMTTAVNCPVTELQHCNETVDMSTLGGIGTTLFIANRNNAITSSTINTTQWNGEPGLFAGVSTLMNIEESRWTKNCENVPIIDLFSADLGEAYPIVAPFNFTFTNSNFDGSTVKIQSADGSVIVIFEKVANWFCAGDAYYTQDWKDHMHHHSTVIGNSNLSTLRSGPSGSIIAYGSDQTTITVVETSGGNQVITLKQLYAR